MAQGQETRAGQPTAEREANVLPTTLHLFRFRNTDQLSIATGRVETSERFKREFATAKSAYAQLRHATNARIESLQHTQDELDQQLINVYSSKTASTAYLAMVDELSPQGVSPSDIFNFFQLCLHINNQLCSTMVETFRSKGPQASLYDGLAGSNNPRYNRIFATIGDPPEWYRGGKEKWKAFVRQHGNFSKYLNQKLAQLARTQRPTLKYKTLLPRPGMTMKDALPDWLDTRNGDVPNQFVVEEELREDTKEEGHIMRQCENLQRHAEAIQRIADQRFAKAAAWVERRKQETFPTLSAFSDVVGFLDATRDITEHAIDPKDMATMTIAQINAFAVSPEKLRERTIQQFAATLPPEGIALLLERKFREAGLMQSTQDDIDIVFAQAILAIGTPALRDLHEQHKKVYRVFKYDLAPLFSLLSNEELTYLKELAQDSLATPIEPLLWEMAELISLRCRNKEGVAITELHKFTANWLRNNWQWAYQELKHAISRGVEEPTANDTPSPKRVEPEGEDVVEVMQELKQAAQEVDEGNLSGWRLYYAPQRSTDEDALLLLEGNTMGERETVFERFIRQNGIPCSIKPTSVMRALEWLITVPQEIEWVRIRKDIGGEVFKKLKRGAVRIFYQMFPEEQRLIFFIHQKKAWEYGF